MTEFLMGLAIGAMLMCAWAYAMWRQDRAERRSIPVPEPDDADDPVAGEKWVLSDRVGTVVTVEEVVAGHVFYGFDGSPMRSMPVYLFRLMYRRVA